MCDERDGIVVLDKAYSLCAECAARHIRAQSETLQAALRGEAEERKRTARALGELEKLRATIGRLREQQGEMRRHNHSLEMTLAKMEHKGTTDH